MVTLCSNAISVNPIRNAKRWFHGKGQVNVSQSAMVGIYNSEMGGVDLVDRALSQYRPEFQGKKWYWPLIVNAINLGMFFLLACLPTQQQKYCTEGLYSYISADPDKKVNNNV